MSPAAPLKVAPPRLSADVDLVPLDVATIEDGESYRSRILADSAFGGATTNLTLEGARLIQVRLDGSQWDRSFWSDLILHGCDLSNLRWRRGVLRRVRIESSRAVGFSLDAESRAEDVELVDCNCELASFRFARFKSVRFDHCLLREADFQGVDLTSSAFVACDLRGAEFSGAKLAGIDLRGCQLEGVRAGPAELKGAIIDPVQAVALAEALGLTVEWATEPGESAPA